MVIRGFVPLLVLPFVYLTLLFIVLTRQKSIINEKKGQANDFLFFGECLSKSILSIFFHHTAFWHFWHQTPNSMESKICKIGNMIWNKNDPIKKCDMWLIAVFVAPKWRSKVHMIFYSKYSKTTTNRIYEYNINK